jgi:hypothetical protein
MIHFSTELKFQYQKYVNKEIIGEIRNKPFVIEIDKVNNSANVAHTVTFVRYVDGRKIMSTYISIRTITVKVGSEDLSNINYSQYECRSLIVAKELRNILALS